MTSGSGVAHLAVKVVLNILKSFCLDCILHLMGKLHTASNQEGRIDWTGRTLQQMTGAPTRAEAKRVNYASLRV